MKNAIDFSVNIFNKKREELPLFEDVLLKKEQYCKKISDDKIKELLSKFTYAEDKIIFYEDNFYTLLKQNKEVNLNIPQNNMEFDYMIRKVSQDKSYEYNKILVPKKPKWADKKKKIKLKIDKLCEEFIKQVIGNKSFKEEIKYDIKILDKEIESLNLFNGINKNKHNEIKNLINNRKEETKKKILLERNSLMDWSIIKELKINEGKEIMNNKLNSNFDPKNLNLKEIKKILIDEVRNYPRFGDEFRNKKDLYNKIFEELEKKAEEITRNYLNKKKAEEEKNLKKQKELKDLLK
jgi:hypothetical protein